MLVAADDWVDQGAVLASRPVGKTGGAGEAKDGEQAIVPAAGEGDIVARISGRVMFEGKARLLVVYEEKEEREYLVPAAVRILVEHGEAVKAGERLTEGPLNPQDILRIMGPEAVQLYLVEEVQKVYRSQGVNINDKHIETIVRQMLRKVRVDSPCDTQMLGSSAEHHCNFPLRDTALRALALVCYIGPTQTRTRARRSLHGTDCCRWAAPTPFESDHTPSGVR